MTANETMTSVKVKAENHASEYLDFDDDDVFLPDEALKRSKSSVSEDEMSFRTCDQTIINRKDENKTPVPEFDFEEECDFKVQQDSIPSTPLRTPQAVKAELMAEFASRKEPTTVIKKEVNNSRVFLGEFNNKADNIKKALKKEDDVKPFDPLFGIKVK